MTSGYDCDWCLMTLAQVPLATAIAPSTCPHHVTSGFYRTFLVPVWNFHIAAVGGRRRKKRRRKRKKRALAQKKHGQRSEKSTTMTSRYGRLPQQDATKRLLVSLHSLIGPTSLFGAAWINTWDKELHGVLLCCEPSMNVNINDVPLCAIKIHEVQRCTT